MSENSSPTFWEEMKKIKNRGSIKYDTNELIEEPGTRSGEEPRGCLAGRGQGAWLPGRKRAGSMAAGPEEGREQHTAGLGLADANRCIYNGETAMSF